MTPPQLSQLAMVAYKGIDLLTHETLGQYPEWEPVVLAHFRAKQQETFQIVEGTWVPAVPADAAADAAAQRTAVANILLFLGGRLKRRYSSFVAGHQVWVGLHQEYLDFQQMQAPLLRARFTDMRPESEETVLEYCRRAEQLYDELVEVAAAPSLGVFIDNMLDALAVARPDWMMTVMAVRTNRADMRSLDTVRCRLIEMETRALALAPQPAQVLPPSVWQPLQRRPRTWPK